MAYVSRDKKPVSGQKTGDITVAMLFVSSGGEGFQNSVGLGNLPFEANGARRVPRSQDSRNGGDGSGRTGLVRQKSHVASGQPASNHRLQEGQKYES